MIWGHSFDMSSLKKEESDRLKVLLQLSELQYWFCSLGVGAMTWSPLACGIISGKYDGRVPPYSRASLKVDTLLAAFYIFPSDHLSLCCVSVLVAGCLFMVCFLSCRFCNSVRTIYCRPACFSLPCWRHALYTSSQQCCLDTVCQLFAWITCTQDNNNAVCGEGQLLIGI